MLYPNPAVFFPVFGLLIGLAALIERKNRFYSRLIDQKLASPSFYLPIEGLRGLLALSVIFHHSALTNALLRTGDWKVPYASLYWKLGWAPVDLFFCITGFLFWDRALRMAAQPKPLQFFRARWRRLAPVYLASLALILFIAAGETGFSLNEPPLRVLQEIGRWLAFGLPDGTFPSINSFQQTWRINAGVAWTLRYEWLFYLTLPWLAWFAPKRRFPYLIAGSVLLFYLSRGIQLGLWLKPVRPWVSDGLLDIVMSPVRILLLRFGPGMLTAYIVRMPRLRGACDGRFTRWLPILAMASVFLFIDGEWQGMKAIAFFVVFASVALGGGFASLLSARPILFLGTLSYSVYLFHGIVLFTFSETVDRLWGWKTLGTTGYWCFVIAVGTVTLLLCTIIYRVFEHPYLKAPAPSRAPANPVRQPEAVSG